MTKQSLTTLIASCLMAVAGCTGSASDKIDSGNGNAGTAGGQEGGVAVNREAARIRRVPRACSAPRRPGSSFARKRAAGNPRFARIRPNAASAPAPNTMARVTANNRAGPRSSINAPRALFVTGCWTVHSSALNRFSGAHRRVKRKPNAPSESVCFRITGKIFASNPVSRRSWINAPAEPRARPWEVNFTARNLYRPAR